MGGEKRKSRRAKASKRQHKGVQGKENSKKKRYSLATKSQKKTEGIQLGKIWQILSDKEYKEHEEVEQKD